MPENEAQTRALSGLEPEEQRTAWKQAVDTATEGKVTARHISAVKVDIRLPTDQESKKRIKMRQQQGAFQSLWQWVKDANWLDPESAADNCPDEKLARGYITESENAVAIIRRYQTRLEKRFKLVSGCPVPPKKQK